MKNNDDELLKMIDATFWKKTNYISPHEYILQAKEPVLHAALSELIDNHGYKTMFMGKEYTCYDIGEYKYWHMGDVVNRALKTEGETKG